MISISLDERERERPIAGAFEFMDDGTAHLIGRGRVAAWTVHYRDAESLVLRADREFWVYQITNNGTFRSGRQHASVRAVCAFPVRKRRT